MDEETKPERRLTIVSSGASVGATTTSTPIAPKIISGGLSTAGTVPVETRRQLTFVSQGTASEAWVEDDDVSVPTHHRPPSQRYTPPKDRPTPREEPLPVARRKIGDELEAKLIDAIEHGRPGEREKAIEAAARLGINHPKAQQRREANDLETRRLAAKRQQLFQANLCGARLALKRARRLVSYAATQQAVCWVEHFLRNASADDKENRPEALLRALIGTTQKELDGLPDSVVTTMTVVPIDVEALEAARSKTDKSKIATTAVVEPKLPRRRTKPSERVKIAVRVSNVAICEDGTQRLFRGRRDVQVEHISTQDSQHQPAPPIVEVCAAQPIDPPSPRICYKPGTEYGKSPYLLLRDDRHRFEGSIGDTQVPFMGAGQLALMMRQRATKVDDELVGENRWVYQPLAPDGEAPSEDMLTRSSQGIFGTYKEPSPFSPALILLCDIAGDRSAKAIVKIGEMTRTIDIPWSDELLGGKIVDLLRWDGMATLTPQRTITRSEESVPAFKADND